MTVSLSSSGDFLRENASSRSVSSVKPTFFSRGFRLCAASLRYSPGHQSVRGARRFLALAISWTANFREHDVRENRANPWLDTFGPQLPNSLLLAHERL